MGRLEVLDPVDRVYGLNDSHIDALEIHRENQANKKSLHGVNSEALTVSRVSSSARFL